jgi:TRAP-type C4-dicarboxylate transport system substrate-binding protein
MKEMRAGALEVFERTEGRVQIKFYGGGVMGNSSKVLGKIRIGNLHGGAFTPSAMQKIYPEIALYGLPLVFESVEEVAYVRARIDKTIQDGLEKAGYVNFGFASGGFAVIMSNNPVKGLRDMKGKRVWVPEGDTISYSTMQALSLSPVMKFITDMPLVYTMGFMAIDKRAFKKIDVADQQVVREVMTRTYANLDETSLSDNVEALQALLNTGIESVELDPEEASEIRSILSRSNGAMAERGEYSLELYNEMLQFVEEYRVGNAADGGN